MKSVDRGFKFTRACRVLAVLLSLTAGPAIADSRAFVSITVNLDGRSCAVKQRVVGCMTLPDVLVQELGVAHSASLTVSAEGCGREAMVRARAVAGNLKAAGFSRVAVAGFLTESNAGCAH